jgi:CHAD domain-containing protein
LLHTVRSERYTKLLDRLVEAANAPVLSSSATEPASAAIPELVRRPWHTLEKRAKRLGQHPTDGQLHDLRIHTKRLRYASEAAAPIVGKQARALAHAAAALQDVLGDLNDAVVAATWLDEWAADAEDGEARRAAGVLAASERAAAKHLRGRWRAAWDALADPKLRAWM